MNIRSSTISRLTEKIFPPLRSLRITSFPKKIISRYFKGLRFINSLKISIPVNLALPTPSFEMIQTLIRAIVEKAKTNVTSYALKIDEYNAFDYFVGACTMEVKKNNSFLYFLA